MRILKERKLSVYEPIRLLKSRGESQGKFYF